MKSVPGLSVAILFMLPLSGPGTAQELVKDSPYYPLKLGTVWHYKAGANPDTIDLRVTKYEAIGGTTCALLETSGG
jgi:hypothetical protein